MGRMKNVNYIISKEKQKEIEAKAKLELMERQRIYKENQFGKEEV